MSAFEEGAPVTIELNEAGKLSTSITSPSR